MLVRVSVANLVRKVYSRSGSEYIGILSSGAYNKGQRRLQPIGGALELTDAGKRVIEESFFGQNFHKNQEGGIDARFEVDDSLLQNVFDFFCGPSFGYFETDPAREVIQELSGIELTSEGGLPEIPAVLTAEEAESIDFVSVDTVVQPFKNDTGTSTLAKEGIPSRRLFHRFDMVVPNVISGKLFRSDAIAFLKLADILTTEGGLHKGRASSGIELADNFIE